MPSINWSKVRLLKSIPSSPFSPSIRALASSQPCEDSEPNMSMASINAPNAFSDMPQYFARSASEEYSIVNVPSPASWNVAMSLPLASYRSPVASAASLSILAKFAPKSPP